MRCLPDPGGLLQQDPYWIEVFQLILEAEGAKQDIDKQRGDAKARRDSAKRERPRVR